MINPKTAYGSFWVLARREVQKFYSILPRVIAPSAKAGKDVIPHIEISRNLAQITLKITDTSTDTTFYKGIKGFFGTFYRKNESCMIIAIPLSKFALC